MKKQSDMTACATCGRRDFIYGLLTATAGVAAGATVPSRELADFFAALPAPTPADAIPSTLSEPASTARPFPTAFVSDVPPWMTTT